MAGLANKTSHLLLEGASIAMAPLRVVLACQPIPGHLRPNLALARAFAGRGHRPALYSGTMARAAVEEEGFPFYAFQPTMDRLLADMLLPATGSSAISQITNQRGLLFRVRQLNATMKEWLLDTIPQQVEDLETICEEFRADVLISDSTLMGPILVLKDRLTIPVAVYSVLAACSIPGKTDPPWGRGLSPAKTAWGRARNRLQKKVSDWMLADFRVSANRLRGRYGLAPLQGRVADEAARLPLFLVCSCPSFDYYRQDLPECVEYVGACIWNGDKAAQIPDWLANLRADLPVVHVTEGTIFTGEPLLLRAAAAGLSDAPMQVIMTIGRHRKPEELRLGRIGSNIRIEQFVPHKYLFEKTAVVVTSGGAGTVTTSLVAGVPLVVVPTAWDLAENAQRVAECGAGLTVSPRECTPRRLSQVVRTVLLDRHFREQARRIGKDLQAQGGPERACQLIERLVASRGQKRSA